MANKQWQDFANFIIGVWLVISPLVMDRLYGNVPEAAAWSAYILGAAIMVFAIASVYVHRVWEEGLNMLFGVLLIISPWALGFAAHTRSALNAIIAGVLVTGLATWAMIRDKDFEKWRHDHHGSLR
ncbi:MAG TPA: SPW repeat protein [Methylophilaceae bacterium]|nr:SPW repeat protein [Methylophilaceae bacterium]